MAKTVFFICALLLSLGIFTSKGTSRLVWFFTGILFFQDRIVLFDSPTVMSFHRFLIYSLLFAEFISPKALRNFLLFPLKNSLMAVFVGFVCIALFDKRHSMALSLYRAVDIFIKTFLIIYLSYINFNRKSEWERLLKVLLYSSMILCSYGIYNFITKSNPVDALVTRLYNPISTFDEYILGDRFRINSTVSHPIYYGYLVGTLLILVLYIYIIERKFKLLCLIAMPLLFLNLIFANSRTPLITTGIGIIIFIILALNKKMILQFFIVSTCVGIATYNVPFIQKKIESSIDVFQTGGNKTSGSSISMRKQQLKASYYEFNKSPITGNGFLYIKENLGFTNFEDNNAPSDFEGFESYIFILIIEQGLIGIITNCIFFLSLALFFLKNMRKSIQLAGLGFAFLIAFLFFIIGTGPLGSWIITMGILGILISKLNNFQISS